MSVKVLKIEDVGNDVLRVTGEVDEQEVVVTGWVSSLTNHYELDNDGERVNPSPKAKPRNLTKKEVKAYCVSLLRAAAPATTDLSKLLP